MALLAMLHRLAPLCGLRRALAYIDEELREIRGVRDDLLRLQVAQEGGNALAVRLDAEGPIILAHQGARALDLVDEKREHDRERIGLVELLHCSPLGFAESDERRVFEINVPRPDVASAKRHSPIVVAASRCQF